MYGSKPSNTHRNKDMQPVKEGYYKVPKKVPKKSPEKKSLAGIRLGLKISWGKKCETPEEKKIPRKSFDPSQTSALKLTQSIVVNIILGKLTDRINLVEGDNLPLPEKSKKINRKKGIVSSHRSLERFQPPQTSAEKR